MIYRVLLTVVWIVGLSSPGARAEVELPVGSNPPALSFPHFPDRVHALVWRNWDLVEPRRIAEVLETSVENINNVALSMGLPPSRPLRPGYEKRAYITVLRRNWHLLPYEQLLELLGMTREELSFSLREDDFLYVKLGSLKPRCEPLRYRPPAEKTRQRAAAIQELVKRHFGDALAAPGRPRFQFVDELSRVDEHRPRPPADPGRVYRGLRFIYSYFAPFGDPLLDPETDPLPDGLLARLADRGVNGVWLHVVLRQLAPGGEHFPEFGVDHQKRLTRLRQLVRRAKRYGVGVYLYMNEPRAMPSAFFEKRPEMAGVPWQGLVAMCTSDQRVLQWMTDALSYLFREVPDLAGVFTITASENLTNCAVRNEQAQCPRCRDRTQAEIVVEVNAAIEAGVHRVAPKARVIVWDWGWNSHRDASEIVAKLPASVWFMSVSEWAQPFERGGVKHRVGEYSMSVVGPGPRAQRHWEVARGAGLKTVAKMQVNSTWELSAVPYLPVLDLVAEHCANLAKRSIDGQLLSWTVGSYPSPNLRVAQIFAEKPGATKESVLDDLAVGRYGARGAPHARRAWRAFSEAFREFPYDGSVVYNAPQQLGPANLLYAKPTGYAATMVGIPYDDVRRWRGPYPREVLAEQFRKVADNWAPGLEPLRRAVDLSPSAQRAECEADLRVARACWAHFASVANQVDFVLARDRLALTDLTVEGRKRAQEKVRRLLESEIAIARELYDLTKADSRIGFEASNQYYYVPLDLVEKVINCESIRSRLRSQGSL
jgi:hypothetical protein